MHQKKLNYSTKIYCFDIDGVICDTIGNSYNTSKPNKKAIKKINEVFASGHKVIIFTARFMGRSNENIFLAKKKGYQFTYKQLKKWKVKFHKLIFGKPTFDYLIDDKSVNYRKNWHKFI
jgi:hypothetical protein